MLVNLQDSDEDSLPALQSGSVSPPAHSVPPNVGLVDIHLPDGEFEHFTVLTAAVFTLALGPRDGSGVVRIDPLHFLAGCHTRRLNQALSVLSYLSLGFF